MKSPVGMPQAHGGPSQLVSRAEMEIGREDQRLPTDKAAIPGPTEPAIGATGAVKRRNKQSLDYILRSGLAGGLAGCAVSLPL